MNDHPLRAYLQHVTDLHHLLDRKWGLQVLTVLASGPKRFSDVFDALRVHQPDAGWRFEPGHYISHKVLRDTLRTLTDEGLITRQPDSEGTARADRYVLTALGVGLKQVVDHGAALVAAHPGEVENAKARHRNRLTQPPHRHHDGHRRASG